MKVSLLLLPALLLFSACSTTPQAKSQPYFSPEDQQSHSKESLRGL